MSSKFLTSLSCVLKGWAFHTLAWVSCFVLPLACVYYFQWLDAPPTLNQSLLIFIFLSSMMLWTLKLVPPLVPAIYLLLGMILLSLAPHNVVLSGFYSNTFFLLMALSVLSAGIKMSGLSYRFLLFLYRFNTHSKVWKHVVMFLSGVLITPIIPSVNGRAYITHPLFSETLQAYNIQKSSKEYQRLIATSIGGISLLSPIFLTSKSVNLLAFGMLPEQIQYDFQFYYWMVAASLVGVILMAFYAFFSWLLFRNNEDVRINQEQLQAESKALGKFSVAEYFTIASILLFVATLFTKNAHHLNVSWLAVLLLMFVPLILGLYNNKDFNKIVEWDFLIILSSLLGFSATMAHLELNTWISYYLGDLQHVINSNFILFTAYLAITTFILRLFIPINAVVIILCSILIPVATSASLNPWLIVFTVLLFSESFTHRMSASYVINFFNLIKDDTSYWNLTLLQLLMFVVKFGAVILSVPLWQYLGIL